MNTLAVTIVRWVDDWQPGWVECFLTDACERKHVFREKAPVVSGESLDAATAYPRPGSIACEILSRRVDDRGRRVVTVTTAKPWGCESTEGTTTFEVLQKQLCTEPDGAANRSHPAGSEANRPSSAAGSGGLPPRSAI
jgi:hypothetical protein